MDIGELISNAPDLAGGLQELGLDQSKVGELGQAITGQLAGEDGLDIGDLLSGFDAQSFLSRIDVSAVAEKVGISPEIAQTAIDLIAPKIAEFTGGNGGEGSALGGLANVAKGFLGGRD